jgi:hypothetical protein
MFTKLKVFLVMLLIGKEVEDMAVVYATLILKGKKTFAQVPDKIKNQVRDVLIDLEAPEELYA